MRTGILITVMTCMVSPKHRLDFVRVACCVIVIMQSDRNTENLENGRGIDRTRERLHSGPLCSQEL